MSDDDEITTVYVAPLKPWTPVRSMRGKFIHMAWDGRHTLCGVRLRTLVGVPDERVDCWECWEALTFN